MRFVLSGLVIFSTVFLSIADFGKTIESQYAQSLLYGVRDFISPATIPNDITIVTPYTTRRVGDVDDISQWDRREHASALKNIRSVEVGALAIDISFRKSKPYDAKLANSIRTIPRTVLVQQVREVKLNSEVPERPESAIIVADLMRNPVNVIAQAAYTLAPALVSGTENITDRVFLNRQIVYNSDTHYCHGYPSDADQVNGKLMNLGDHISPATVPTLPVVALAIWLDAQKNLRDPSQNNNAIDSYNWGQCKPWNQAAFERLLLDARSDDAYTVTNTTDNLSFIFFVKQWLSLLLSKSDSSLKLNFYGPPRSLRTVSYATLARETENIRIGNAPNTYKGSMIFLGGSFESAADQQADAYNTPYSSNKAPMSGVELAATAFANLANNNAIRVLHPAASSIFILIVTLSVWLASLKRNSRFTLILSSLLLLFVFVLSSWLFISWHILIPLAVPALGVVLTCAIATIFHLKDSNRARSKAEHNLRIFLSDVLLNQLGKQNNHELSETVCMVTDVRNFTSTSSKVSADKLHEINNAYFTNLFECVSRHGADVIKTYGDSMTAVWKITDDSIHTSVLNAGLDILSLNEEAGAPSPNSSYITHIGVSSGKVAIGYVGSINHRSVELTGSAVYLASRLEQLNKKLDTEFLAPIEFMENCKQIHHNPVGLHNIKGFDMAVDLVSIKRRVVHENLSQLVSTNGFTIGELAETEV